MLYMRYISSIYLSSDMWILGGIPGINHYIPCKLNRAILSAAELRLKCSYAQLFDCKGV